VHFEAYNRRYGDDGIHETLEWDENEVSGSDVIMYGSCLFSQPRSQALSRMPRHGGQRKESLGSIDTCT